ncbi:MAG: flagellar hook-length control protein FliK [Rhodobacteraceae bacterium]|nr:flagellar hook-length control protein FliK [Paracoccaceae bacterium]
MQISIAQSLVGDTPVEGGNITATKPARENAFSALFSLLQQEEPTIDSESEPEMIDQSDTENPDELPIMAEVKTKLNQPTIAEIGVGDKRQVTPKKANPIEVMPFSAKPPVVASAVAQEFVGPRQVGSAESALQTIPSVVNNPEILKGVEAKISKPEVHQTPSVEMATKHLRGSKGADLEPQNLYKTSNMQRLNIPASQEIQISRMAESHANAVEMHKQNLQQDYSKLPVEKRAIVPNPAEHLNTADRPPMPPTFATAQAEPVGTDESTKDFSPISEMSESDLARSNLNVGTNSATYATSDAVRSGTVRSAGTQMVDAIIRHPGQPVEVALNPEELGRVRIALTNLDTGLSVSIMAERPETLELMRRHIEQLETEFRQLGYENIGFEFSGGDAQTSGQSESNSQLTSDQTTDIADPTNLSTLSAQTTGLDIRL